MLGWRASAREHRHNGPAHSPPVARAGSVHRCRAAGRCGSALDTVRAISPSRTNDRDGDAGGPPRQWRTHPDGSPALDDLRRLTRIEVEDSADRGRRERADCMPLANIILWCRSALGRYHRPIDSPPPSLSDPRQKESRAFQRRRRDEVRHLPRASRSTSDADSCSRWRLTRHSPS